MVRTIKVFMMARVVQVVQTVPVVPMVQVIRLVRVVRQTWKKSAPNHPGKFLHTPPLTGRAHMETTHFKKGLP